MKRVIIITLCVLSLVVYGISWKSARTEEQERFEKAIIGIPVTMSGVTDASGNFTYAFPNSYTLPPNIQANPITTDNKVFLTIQSITTTGFTVKVERRNTLLSGLLGNVEILLATTTPVVGASVDVLITSKQ